MSIYTIEEINNKYLNSGLKTLERFSKEIIAEVKSLNPDISKEDLILYENHTDKNVITIDGEKTQDIDDAIYLEKDNKLYSLTVYIADVSFYVKPGSKLDEEALKRGTSIYLPQKTLPMLPNRLCNDICSLKENKERLTIAINMKFDKKGNLKSRRIFKAIISSKKKMTYEKVNKVLENSDTNVVAEYSDFISQLFLMKDLALLLRKKRKRNYFLDLNLPEFEFFIPTSWEFEHMNMTTYERTISNIIIEEFMLAANFNIAEFFYNLGLPFIYRIHGMPNLSNFNFNIKLSTKKLFQNSGYLVKILSKKLTYSRKSRKTLLAFNILNSLNSAKYSEIPSGHFALNAKYYCHFTSPIRRYPDLFIHRIISEYLENNCAIDKIKEKYETITPEIAQKCSEAESFAKRVSREFENMYMLYYMQDFIGEKFKASIYKISKNHISIYIKHVMVTGKIKISTISEITNSHAMLFENKIIFDANNIYKLYDNLIVTLTGIDKGSSNLIFEIDTKI